MLGWEGMVVCCRPTRGREGRGGAGAALGRSGSVGPRGRRGTLGEVWGAEMAWLAYGPCEGEGKGKEANAVGWAKERKRETCCSPREKEKEKG